MSDEKRKEDIGTEHKEVLKAFEAALASLVPRTDRLDRDRLMFLAGQQSILNREKSDAMPTLAVGMSEPAEKTQHAHGKRGHGTPIFPIHRTSRWAWPAAFSAMTTVTVVLAILLAIRPTVPVAVADRTSTTSPVNETRITSITHPQNRDLPPAPTDSEQDFANQSKPSSPLLTFIQSLWNITDSGKATENSILVPDSITPSYPQLRDHILRHGLDSWQIAQTNPGSILTRLPEPSTNRELLKEYMSELK
jgi:hypothetical protein